MRKLMRILLALLLIAVLPFCTLAEVLIDEDYAISETCEVEYGSDYLSKDEVALYLYAFDELPPNYITKNEAKALGWISSKGNLWEVAYGFAIGGDRFGNREGRLPKGYQWYEADVNYDGGSRNAERLLFCEDGLIYYTDDHYNTFLLLYDKEEENP